MDATQLDKIKAGHGFFAALDQSGGSTPKALAEYGIAPDRYGSDTEMFDLVHAMRSRVLTSPAFDGSRVLAAILFEQTMDRDVNGVPSAQYLWDDKNVVPILKVDKGLADERDDVRLMKPIDTLDDLLDRANRHRIFGTKMRSVINDANAAGIAAIVDQQFEYAGRIMAAGLVPILEPEVSVTSPHKEDAETLLRDAIAAHLKELSRRRARHAEDHHPDAAGPVRRTGRRPARAADRRAVRRLRPGRGVCAARPRSLAGRQLLPCPARRPHRRPDRRRVQRPARILDRTDLPGVGRQAHRLTTARPGIAPLRPGRSGRRAADHAYHADIVRTRSSVAAVGSAGGGRREGGGCLSHFRPPFVLARMAAHRTVLVTVLVITLVVGAVLAALAVYDGRALREAAFERLAGSDTAITVTAQSSSAAQSATQTSAVRSDATSALGPGGGTVTSVLWSNSENLPAGAVPGAPPTDQDQAVLAGFGSLGGSAKLLTGQWPGAELADDTVAAAVPEAVAASLRLGVGSAIDVTDAIDGGTVRLRIVGIYRPLGSANAYAVLNQVPGTGVRSASSFSTYGPFDVDPSAFANGLVTPAQTTWDVQPSPLVLAGRGPEADSTATRVLDSALRNSATLGTAQVATTLPTQLSALTTALDTARTELAGVALILLALTIAALIVTVRPLGAQREAETGLLALRGRSRRQAALADAGEAVTLGVVTMLAAAPAGTLLAVFLGRDGPLGTGGDLARQPGLPSTPHCRPVPPGSPCWASRCSRPPS